MGGEPYFSERQEVYRQTRGQGIRAWRSGGGVETRTRAATRGGGGEGLGRSLVDSDDDEVEVLPDELRQLQREAGEESSALSCGGFDVFSEVRSGYRQDLNGVHQVAHA